MKLPMLVYRHECPEGCQAQGEVVTLRPVVRGSWFERPPDPVCVYTDFPLARLEEEPVESGEPYPLTLDGERAGDAGPGAVREPDDSEPGED